MQRQPSDQCIHVTVKVFGGLRESLDQAETAVSLPASANIPDLLTQVEASHPKVGAAVRRGLSSGYLQLLINGQIVRPSQHADAALSDGDVVAFLPPVGGG